MTAVNLKDPFSYKSKSKLSPDRLLFTAKSRLKNKKSKKLFQQSVLPTKLIENIECNFDSVSWDDTSVTKDQMSHIAQALADTEHLNLPLVEVGCYRGVTTRFMSEHTKRDIYAVDPFMGYGSADHDFEKFKANIKGRDNAIPVRKTSGKAAQEWNKGPISFAFIDAVHDYVNTQFDTVSWWSYLVKGGIMAFHDTDDINFPGTRRAVYEKSLEADAELYAHPDNIVLLRKI